MSFIRLQHLCVQAVIHWETRAKRGCWNPENWILPYNYWILLKNWKWWQIVPHVEMTISYILKISDSYSSQNVPILLQFWIQSTFHSNLIWLSRFLFQQKMEWFQNRFRFKRLASSCGVSGPESWNTVALTIATNTFFKAMDDRAPKRFLSEPLINLLYENSLYKAFRSWQKAAIAK